jgi:hypothetical protein
MPSSAASFVFVPQAIVDGKNAMEIKSFTSQKLVPVPVEFVDEEEEFDGDTVLDTEFEQWIPEVELNIETEAGNKAFAKWVEDNKIEMSSYEDYQDALEAYGIEMGYILREAVRRSPSTT